MSPPVITVIPAYNEEGKIGDTVRRAKAAGTFVYVTDDGSTDGTYEEAQDAGADHVVRHPANRGAGAAYRNGIDYALKHEFDVMIFCGGDNQDALDTEVQRLLDRIAEGYDFVQGSRYMPGGCIVDQPRFRTFTTRTYTRYVNLMTGARLTDASNGFRAFDMATFRRLVEEGWLNPWQDWLDRYCMEIYILYKQLTHPRIRHCEVPVTKTYHRGLGNTKMRPIIDWWNVVKPILWLKMGLRR